MFTNIQCIKDAGFNGFLTIGSLMASKCSQVPQQEGVYMVLLPDGVKETPEYLNTNPAYHFNGRNPTVPIPTLQAKWVDNTIVLYIGKAGNLQSRLQQYMNFGSGLQAAHWGGRYIWQLANSKDLIVCWKETSCCTPRKLEKDLIRLFEDIYCKLPFANLRR